jgi:hypothetical protein
MNLNQYWNKYKEPIIQEAFQVLERNDVKSYLKSLMKPIIDLILQEIYPYLIICLIFVCVSFLLILATFLLILRPKWSEFFFKQMEIKD